MRRYDLLLLCNFFKDWVDGCGVRIGIEVLCSVKELKDVGD
jgi:hypothetical protein